MTTKLKSYLLIMAVILIFSSCQKQTIGILNTGNYTNTSGTIKTLTNSAGFPFGMAVDYATFNGNTQYATLVKNEASSVTFGNELKYGSIVQNDGSFNYTTADAFYNAVTGAGLQVYGHNLVWYQQQNSTYLNGITGGGGTSVPNLLSNGSFETWSSPTSAPSGWSYFNGSSYFSQATGANAYDGSYALAVNGYGTTIGSSWHVQLGTSFPTVVGDQIQVSFYAKASVANACQIQGEGNNGGSTVTYIVLPSSSTYVSTSWTQYTYTFTALAANTTITMDLAGNPTGSTIYIDKVLATDATQNAANSAPTAIASRVDSVLHLWINSAVSHYAGKIKAWDVLNEPLAEDGTIRTNSNLPSGVTTTTAGVFVWSQYLGKDVGVKAFTYAHAADPNALLFVNDYNLESNSVKLDSLIAYVSYLKNKGVQVDGIGTQMHVSIISSYAGIDAMFQKLAATGLKIRISELDVKVNQANKTNLSQIPVPQSIWAAQADMYKYIVSSYIKNVPAAQRYGITVWGVTDNTSWLYHNTTSNIYDYPLLFDSTYNKKPAYAGFLQGLQ